MGIHVPPVGSTQEGGWNPTGTWPFATASADVHLPRNMATQPSEKDFTQVYEKEWIPHCPPLLRAQAICLSLCLSLSSVSKPNIWGINKKGTDVGRQAHELSPSSVTDSRLLFTPLPSHPWEKAKFLHLFPHWLSTSPCLLGKGTRLDASSWASKPSGESMQ